MWFIFGVITLSTELRTLSIFEGFAVVNKSWKYFFATVAILPSKSHHTPSLSKTPPIWFFLRGWLALWWKNCVFVPAYNQMDLDLWCQWSSLLYSLVLISSFTFFMASAFSTLFSPGNSSNTLCFSSKIAFEFPKVLLLHPTNTTRQLFIFSNRLYIGLPMETALVHATLITDSHFGWVAYFPSNHFGTLFIFGCCQPCVVSSMGMWSE